LFHNPAAALATRPAVFSTSIPFVDLGFADAAAAAAAAAPDEVEVEVCWGERGRLYPFREPPYGGGGAVRAGVGVGLAVDVWWWWKRLAMKELRGAGRRFVAGEGEMLLLLLLLMREMEMGMEPPVSGVLIVDGRWFLLLVGGGLSESESYTKTLRSSAGFGEGDWEGEGEGEGEENAEGWGWRCWRGRRGPKVLALTARMEEPCEVLVRRVGRECSLLHERRGSWRWSGW
jgi:hypothetical protein